MKVRPALKKLIWSFQSFQPSWLQLIPSCYGFLVAFVDHFPVFHPLKQHQSMAVIEMFCVFFLSGGKYIFRLLPHPPVICRCNRRKQISRPLLEPWLHPTLHYRCISPLNRSRMPADFASVSGVPSLSRIWNIINFEDFFLSVPVENPVQTKRLTTN